MAKDKTENAVYEGEFLGRVNRTEDVTENILSHNNGRGTLCDLRRQNEQVQVRRQISNGHN
jgi:hypothetical protein